MFGVLLAVALLGFLIAITARVPVIDRGRMLRLLVLAYCARLLIHLFVRDLELFSHSGGGDSDAYEDFARIIAERWQFSGFEYMTAEQFPVLGATTLPHNLFALIITLNGGEPTSIGCTALIAFLACLTCLNLYALAVDFGADPRRAQLLLGALLFSPAYLMYTSDMYKDGIVIFCVTAALSCSIRLARRFSLLYLALGALSIWTLFYVRHYLVFVVTAPLVVGVAGLRAKNAARPLIMSLLLLGAFLLAAASTDVFDDIADRATTTWERGTDANVRQGNAAGGSGVTFDDGGNAFGAMGPKLAYMLFAPFPWAGGSIGFHIGKIDTALWYYFLYRGWKAARARWKQDRTLIMMLGTFIVPTLIMYATSYANVGLSLRQRLVVVAVTGVLAMMSFPRGATQRVTRPSREVGGRSPATPALAPVTRMAP